MKLFVAIQITNPRKLLLVDGVGALLTAFMLSFVLTTFESSLGMPRAVLYTLAGWAFVYATYSLRSYFVAKKQVLSPLYFIAWANVAYCCLTAILVVYFYQKISILCITYFVLEIIIILSLARIEWQTFSKFSDKN